MLFRQKCIITLICLMFPRDVHNLSTDAYLTNYWPITNGTMHDISGGNAHMTQGSKTLFATDRCGTPDSALNLNGGFTHVPAGIYFKSEFSITAWVYPSNVGSWARLIDFGGLLSKNYNIMFSLSSDGLDMPSLQISDKSSWKFQAQSSQALTLNTWSFLVATFSGTNADVYINGVHSGTATGQYFMPDSTTRYFCLIGKSLDLSDGYSSSYVDDLRFYNISLTTIQINELMSMPCYSPSSSTFSSTHSTSTPFTSTSTHSTTISTSFNSTYSTTTSTPFTSTLTTFISTSTQSTSISTPYILYSTPFTSTSTSFISKSTHSTITSNQISSTLTPFISTSTSFTTTTTQFTTTSTSFISTSTHSTTASTKFTSTLTTFISTSTPFTTTSSIYSSTLTLFTSTSTHSTSTSTPYILYSTHSTTTLTPFISTSTYSTTITNPITTTLTPFISTSTTFITTSSIYSSTLTLFTSTPITYISASTFSTTITNPFISTSTHFITTSTPFISTSTLFTSTSAHFSSTDILLSTSVTHVSSTLTPYRQNSTSFHSTLTTSYHTNSTSFFSMDIHSMSMPNINAFNDIMHTYTSDLSGCLVNCSNRGYCAISSITRLYQCVCLSSFAGAKCQFNLDPCSTSQCLNNGTCLVKKNDSSQFSCECTPTFYGEFCENQVDLCANHTCSSKGSCFVNTSTLQAECKCFKGFYGLNCGLENEARQIVKYAQFSSILVVGIVAGLFVCCITLNDLFNHILCSRNLKLIARNTRQRKKYLTRQLNGYI